MHEKEEGELPTVDMKGLLGRTFITNPTADGEQHRAEVVQARPTGDTTADGQDAMVWFKCKHGDRFFEEVIVLQQDASMV